jgi:predicted dehydrogenase
MLLSCTHVFGQEPPQSGSGETIRLGIIGLDTSHVIAFTKLLNAENPASELAGVRVVAAYPKGSPDIESSVSRVPQYTEQIQKLGVEIVPSIEALLARVDGVLLETNDGRPHLEQVRPVLAAKKPVFIDKPIAGSLADAVTIAREAKEAGVPIFSSSSYRYSPAALEIRGGAIGEVIGCSVYSPCSLEATHPDLFWYGIHGVELLFTVMGRGCESVVRVSSDGTDVVVGKWADGRIGTYRGIRAGQGGSGGTAFGSEAVRDLGRSGGYEPLVAEIVQFFRTGKSPVDIEETLEIYAFMEAADESKRRGGTPVRLEEVLGAAQ